MRHDIPKYFLYGELSHDVDERFLHVESIAERSRLHDWHIKPHAHGNLHHLLLVTTGGGVMQAEESQHRFRRPCLIRVPMAYVHGFRFEPETDGWIVTVSGALLGRITSDYPELKALFADAAAMSLSAADSGELASLFKSLVKEFRGSAPARRAAIESRLIALQVAALRLVMESESHVEVGRRSDALLVAKYRALVEDHYRGPKSVAQYAAQLCVSAERLRQACAGNAGISPLALLNARRLLEAKRGLLYTNMTVSEVADSCGFEDPAYFSRFFTRETGESPRSYRLARSGRIGA
jgi:AraC family transcriptional regulator, transcriptional activator of pobA